MTAQLRTEDQPITTTDLALRAEPAKPARRSRRYFDSYYTMQGDAELWRAGHEQSFPTSQRLDYLAQSRMKRWGHASFDRGELQRELGCSRPTMKKALETLMRGHSIARTSTTAPGSTELCIVLSCKRYRRADRAYEQCVEPSHKGLQRRMWNPDTGWEKQDREWQDHLDGIRILRTTETTEKIERTHRETELIEIPPPALVARRPDGWQGCPNGHYWSPGSVSEQTGECEQCEVNAYWREVDERIRAQAKAQFFNDAA